MRKERTCISCGEKTAGAQLLRWLNFNGKIVPDWIGNLEGRAVYTHLDKECVRGFYDRKSFSSRFCHGKPDYFYPRDKIASHLREQAQRSIRHFLSLAKKSGAVIRGQNLIVSNVKDGTDIKYCFHSQDASLRTVKLMRENVESVKEIKFTKSELGSFFDGRDTAVFALDSSEISEKVVHYIKVFENFFSGDIDAN